MWQAESGDFPNRLQEFFLVMVIVRKPDDVHFVFLDQFCRHHDEIGADGFQRGREIFLRQAESLEPMNKIGGQEKNLEESDVGSPTVGGDFAHGVVVQKLPNILLYDSPWSVEKIDSPRTQLQVGHQDMVEILLVVEKFQLFCFLRGFRNRTPDHDKAMFPVPTPVNTLPEFPCLPPIAKALEPARLCTPLEVGILRGDHDISAAGSIEKSDHATAVVSGVHPESDPASGNGWGRLAQTGFDKRDRAAGGGRIAGSQTPMPEFLEVGLETEQRMIGTPSVLLGIVTNGAARLLSVDGNDHRIHIEDQRGSLGGKSEKIHPQTVVQSDQAADCFGRQSFQESPQRTLIRETIQTQHFQKRPIVLQDFGLVDAPKSHDDGEDECQNKFGRMIIGTPLGSLDISLEQMTKSELVAKTLNQPHPTEVRDMGFVEGKTDFSGTFWHMTQNTPLGRFLSQDLICLYYTSFSSIIHVFS